MKKQSSEADARILIDALLRGAGWDPTDKSQVQTEVTISGTMALHDGPAGVAEAEDEVRRMDYILLGSNGRPLAVGEGKRAAINPYTAKNQTLPLAKRVGAPFIFLSNGDITYFWDHENDDARIVSGIFSRRDLERLVYLRKEGKPLATIVIPEDFLRAGEVRITRPYQKDLMRAMDVAVELGKRRFLVELPTGTGKTDVICLQSKRMFKANRSERLLFLVDLRLAYRRAGGNMVDFVRHALGIEKLKSTEDIITENFQAWLVTKNVTPEQAQYLSLLKNRGIAKGAVLIEDLFEPPLSILNAAEVGIELFGEQGLQAVVEDMNQSLFGQRKAA
jgi:type I site-specific restriction endonuclease